MASANRSQLTAWAWDTWGVDFALLDGDGGLIANPFHYRDARTDGMLDEAFKYMPREEIFTHTGTPIGTLLPDIAEETGAGQVVKEYTPTSQGA